MKQLDNTWGNCSISEHTMRTCDVTKAITDFLDEQGYSFESFLEKAEEYLNEYLWDYMNQIAPDGFYFGAHPGDGSDYGFWELEVDE